MALILDDKQTAELVGHIWDENGTLRTVYRTSVDKAASGEVVAAQGAGVKIRVLGYVLSSSAAINAHFRSAATPISATHYFAANGSIVVPEGKSGWFQTAANEALNLQLSGAGTIGTSVIWHQVE